MSNDSRDNQNDLSVETVDEMKDDHQEQTVSDQPGWIAHWNLLVSLFILAVVLVLEYAFDIKLPKLISLVVNGFAYLGVN